LGPELGLGLGLGLGGECGVKARAAQTAWEVLASSVSQFCFVRSSEYVRGLTTNYTLTGRRVVVAGAPTSAYGGEAPAAGAHGTRSGGYVRVLSTLSNLHSVPFVAPILGDPLYGSAASSPQVLARTTIPEGRLFLHASSISFWVRILFFLSFPTQGNEVVRQRYRRDGLRKRFRLTIAAPLPADFAKVCQDVNLSLPEGVIEGGAFIDGERLEGDGTTSEEGQWLEEPFSI